MNNKETVIKFEKDASVPILRINLDLDDFTFIQLEFKRKLKWFEDEFDELFSSKTNNITEEDIEILDKILNRLSETINEYKDNGLLFELTHTLNRIEKNHSGFF